MLMSTLTVLNSTCKLRLTGERDGGETMTSDELLASLTAIAHPLRLRIIAELTGGRVHVSELARRLGMSRPLLYMHLDRLEKADLVTGHLELSQDGKAMKYLELVPFELRVTAETVVDALAEDAGGSTDDGSGTQALETEQNDL
jgi:DNA-binding transcriptional ArsR family regulator